MKVFIVGVLGVVLYIFGNAPEFQMDPEFNGRFRWCRTQKIGRQCGTSPGMYCMDWELFQICMIRNWERGDPAYPY
jgi:hypothetical protein